MYDLDSLIDRASPDPFPGWDGCQTMISILGRSIEVVGWSTSSLVCLTGPAWAMTESSARTWGFEPSGRAHIGWKVLADQISSMLEGANVLIFMADWHAWVNDKFDGDMAAIQATATYMEATFCGRSRSP